MGEISEIEWCDATWNPWMFCRKLSPGCKNCYVDRLAVQYGWDPAKIRRSKTRFDAPLHFSRRGIRVFVCSLSDFWLQEADEWRTEVWRIIRQRPDLTFQIPTKRPERIREHLPPDWGAGYPNVWLGVSVELQEYTHRMDILRNIPARVRFGSIEPQLGEVILDLTGFQWIITGGESDRANPRPADPDWFRSIRDQCTQQGVAYFHKQNGGSSKCKCHRAWGCRLLDGITWDQFPLTNSNAEGS